MYYNTLQAYVTIRANGNENSHGDPNRPKTNEENFEGKRQQYLKEKKKQFETAFFSPSPLTVKEINHYLDLAYQDEERRYPEGFQAKYLRGLTSEEKKKKKVLQRRAAELLVADLLDACDNSFDIEVNVMERDRRIQENKKTNPEYSESTEPRALPMILKQFAGGMNKVDFLKQDEKTRSKAFLQCLSTLETMMRESLIAQSDEDTLDFFEKYRKIILLTGDLDGPEKLNEVATLFGVQNDPAVIEEIERYKKNYIPIVNNATSIVNRVTVMADPLSTEVEVGDLCNLYNQMCEYVDEDGERLGPAEKFLIQKGIEPSTVKVEGQLPLRPFSAFSDFRKWNDFLYAGDKHFVNPQSKVLESVVGIGSSNIKFFLEEVCHEKIEDVRFFDPDNPEQKLTFKDGKKLFTDMTQGKVGLYQGKDGVLHEIALDPVLIQIKKPAPMRTLNPNIAIDRKVVAAQMLDALGKVQTYSLSRSPEFKALDTAIRRFAKTDCKSFEASQAAFDDIVKAANDYINLKRFPEKEMNGKTFKRVAFAKNVLEVFGNAKALGVIKPTKLDREPTVSDAIKNVQDAISSNDEQKCVNTYLRLVEMTRKMPLPKDVKTELQSEKATLRRIINARFVNNYETFLAEYENDERFRKDTIQKARDERANELDWEEEELKENAELKNQLEGESREQVFIEDEIEESQTDLSLELE